MNKRKNTQPPVMVDANVTRSALADAVIGVACTIDTICTERESLRQETTALRQETHSIGEDLIRVSADRDRLAARCTSLEETNEGLERRLQFVREMQRHHLFNATSLHIAMYGWAQKYDAAQAAHGCAEERSEPKASGRSEATGDGSPPASDATDNTDGETK